MPNLNSAFNLSTCARPNILALKPYRCARDDYKDDGTNILLDANENAYGPALALDEDGGLESSGQKENVNGANSHNKSGIERAGESGGRAELEIDIRGLNRYPDPHQTELKQRLCDLRNNPSTPGPSPPPSSSSSPSSSPPLTPANLFVGVGSDEAIDSLLRCFCVPGRDKMLICPPTYGMYSVSAQVNDVAVVTIPLDVQDRFALRPDAVNAALAADPLIKLVYLCSPGNPTGSLLDEHAIAKVLAHDSWNGIVVVDEAYIDFARSGDASLARWVTRFPNLVVLQTLSKAFGLAGARIGAAFAAEPVARLLNNLKAPYNISGPTSQLARAALSPSSLGIMRERRDRLLRQRDRLVDGLGKIPGVGKIVGGFDANFLLVQMLDRPTAAAATGDLDDDGTASNEVALSVYEGLAEKQGVVVRFRGKEYGCMGCLRITVGTEEEVDRCLAELGIVLKRVYHGLGVVGNEGGTEIKGRGDVVTVNGSADAKAEDANGVIA